MSGARAWTMAALVTALAGAGPAGAGAAAGAPIQDNSFLIEEAYNQESRVVQHISTWTRFEPGGEHAFAFTEEWPLAGQRHQLSYTIPLESRSEGGSRVAGLSDVAIHYRYQWLGMGEARLAVAPRLTLVLPTGDADRSLGAGAGGVEANLPLSFELSSRLVTHTNAGLSYTGEARGAAARRGWNLGQSLVWLALPGLNPLIELAWERSEAVGEGARDREESLLVSPGLRWAHDFSGGLQIVPGLAVPIGIGPSRGDSAVLLYLSFEHGF
ncbi:MAG TPA: transporter [Candidatus Eisenbacteria bacterium]|jgi:hypothetical protein